MDQYLNARQSEYRVLVMSSYANLIVITHQYEYPVLGMSMYANLIVITYFTWFLILNQSNIQGINYPTFV